MKLLCVLAKVFAKHLFGFDFLELLKRLLVFDVFGPLKKLLKSHMICFQRCRQFVQAMISIVL